MGQGVEGTGGISAEGLDALGNQRGHLPHTHTREAVWPVTDGRAGHVKPLRRFHAAHLKLTRVTCQLYLSRAGKNPQTGARSTCPHREPHPQDRDTGYRGRGDFLCPTARILTLSMSSLGSAHFLLAQSEREAGPEPRGPEAPCPPRPSVS